MSQSKSKEEEARVYLLPKKGSSYVHLPDDSSKVTQIKVTDLQIEDFLERLNESVQDIFVGEDFIKSPKFEIGGQLLQVGIYIADNNCVYVSTDVYSDLTSIGVSGTCGNLRIGPKTTSSGFVNLGSIEELQEAMTTTGNQNLYLQVTVTVIVPENSDDDEWIIQR